MEAAPESHRPREELRLEVQETELPRNRTTRVGFRIVGPDGREVENFQVEHDKPMHLIVVRRDLTGFQHLHPELHDQGEWATDITLPDAGSYRVFTDFNRDGESHTLEADLTVPGEAVYRPLPPPAADADTGDGYQVRLAGAPSKAGEHSELGFSVTLGHEEVAVEEYLGARGHLVALREEDLAYLHVHPLGGGHGAGHRHEGVDPEDVRDGEEDAAAPIRFMAEFPSGGRYGLFLQFKHGGTVHTAAFTREVAR